MKYLIACFFLSFFTPFGSVQCLNSDKFVKDPVLTRYPVSRFLVQF